MTSPQVFDGIRVLDIGHIVAGPFSASLLADFGADVIKIEQPQRGDPLRWIYPRDGVGLFYKVQARNKRSVTLDLKHERGRELFHELVKASDVVVENFRPGVLERLGADPETLHGLNPGLVICRLSGWGQDGPYAHRRSYGRIGEAFAGFAHITGEPDGPPMHSAMSLGDSLAGVWAAYGIAMALYWRDARGGRGQVIDLALYEPMFRQIEQQIVVYDQLGQSLERMGNHNPGVPFVGLYPTKDGAYFTFSSHTMESVMDLLRAMGLDEDERFTSHAAALENRDEFIAAVSEWMASRTLEEVTAAFASTNAAGSAVMSAADLIEDPHIQARDMVITVEDEELGPVRMQGIVPKLSETPGQVRHAGQRLGDSNRDVLRELLGLDDTEIEALKREGVI